MLRPNFRHTAICSDCRLLSNMRDRRALGEPNEVRVRQRASGAPGATHPKIRRPHVAILSLILRHSFERMGQNGTNASPLKNDRNRLAYGGGGRPTSSGRPGGPRSRRHDRGWASHGRGSRTPSSGSRPPTGPATSEGTPITNDDEVSANLERSGATCRPLCVACGVKRHTIAIQTATAIRSDGCPHTFYETGYDHPAKTR
jgi:hypothetical protein